MQNFRSTSKSASYALQARASCLAGRYRDALRHADKALKYEEDATAEAYYWAAATHLGMQNQPRARELVEVGLGKFPKAAGLMSLMGGFLSDDGQYERASAMLHECVELEPSLTAGWITYAGVLFWRRDFVGSRDAALKALALEPNNIFALANLSGALKEMGHVREAMVALRKVSELSPYTHMHRSNLLFTMLFDEDSSPQALRAEAETFANSLASTRRGRVRRGQPPAAGRIRLGLLSNDLHAHACAYFIIPFLTNVDHDRFEVYSFSLNQREDNVTSKIRLYSDQFIELAGKSEAEIAAVLDESGLDVLIDLGGYTGNTPLVYMAYGLAPIQMTWMGYPGTTGMAQVQYRITDWVGDPPGNEPFYTEQLLRAPTIASVYYPLVATPLRVYEQRYAVQQTPALKNGYVTFGCCINLAKISERTLRLWSTVLARCPGSKLLVECNGLNKDEVKLPLLERMGRAGIPAERVICVLRSNSNQYVLYNDIDVVLDTAPMTGGANTCDALWMGVPVVSLAGKAFHERISASCLHAVGLSGLSCPTEQEYVETAVQLAADTAQLNALRLSMRPMFEQSALYDAAAFARWFEQEVTGLVAQYRQVPQETRRGGDGVFFAGQWHSMEQVIMTVIALLHGKQYADLRNMLENISAKWSKHWVVAYGLAEMAYESGNKEWALDLLIEAASLRKFSLPLYRLLSARLGEAGRDKTALAEFLQQAFGLELSYLDQQPLPSMFEIAGVPAQAEEAVA